MTTTDTNAVPGTPAMPEVTLNAVKPNEPVVARVVANERCTERKAAGFVRHVSFDVSGTPLAGAFRPGQAFGVVPPGTDENGKPHKLRLYSLANPTRGEDGAGNVVSTTVKRTVDEHWETGRLFLGVASNYLCDLQPGEEARLTGPAGKRFVLPAEPGNHDYLFFATGTGIAPFRGMLLDLLETDVRSRIVLVMGSPYQTDLLYHADLLRLEQRHKNFTYLTALSREPQPDGHDPMYVHRRMETHQDLLLPMLTTERTLIYVCGLAGMELGIFRELGKMLPDHDLQQYLSVDEQLLSDPDRWEQAMIPRRVRPTPRVLVEVY